MTHDPFYLISDGGGTKVDSLLIDADLRRCGTGSSGGVNTNFVTRELAAERYAETIRSCLATTPVPAIQRLSITGPVDFNLMLATARSILPVYKAVTLSENEAFLAAGAFRRHGLIALAGTGSGAQYRGPDGRSGSVGGKGGPVDDEGSGYRIGRSAIKAAIKAEDGRGPRSSLLDSLLAHVGVTDMGAFVHHLYRQQDQRGFIASLTLLTVREAEAGDAEAIAILRKAGRRMAEQVRALVDRLEIPDRDVLLAGSVWRGNPWMQDSFLATLRSWDPAWQAYNPFFKPVLGAAVRMLFEREGRVTLAWANTLIERFPDYLLAAPDTIRRAFQSHNEREDP
ncbi:MAG: BadF/BadG/BcrA/BcrD ATPase family protein [Bacillota bacterium]|nr:BadF/BadG/BcrA/BcrD ATPase family protein [Bacillota bacterium]